MAAQFFGLRKVFGDDDMAEFMALVDHIIGRRSLGRRNRGGESRANDSGCRTDWFAIRARP